MSKAKKKESVEVQTLPVQTMPGLNFQSRQEYIDFTVWNALKTEHLNESEKEMLGKVYSQFKSKEIREAEMLSVLETYVKIIKEREEQEDLRGKNKFKFAGHIADMQLYFRKPGQLSLFDSIQNVELKNEIKKITKEETIIEGIKLSVVEDRLLNAIFKIVDRQIQNNALAYEGDAPVLDVPLYTLYEAYELQKIKKARYPDYSGGDIDTVKNALFSLEGRRFLIRYVRREIDKKGENTNTIIERYEALIQVAKIYTDLSDKEVNQHLIDDITNDRKGRIKIGLNPILLDQIDTKCILLPKNINTAIIIANDGKKRVSDCVPVFIKYLLRQLPISKKRKDEFFEINYSHLVAQLGLEKELSEGRKQRIENRIEEAIKIARNMNILLEVKEKTGAEEQRKFCFRLNYDY